MTPNGQNRLIHGEKSVSEQHMLTGNLSHQFKFKCCCEFVYRRKLWSIWKIKIIGEISKVATRLETWSVNSSVRRYVTLGLIQYVFYLLKISMWFYRLFPWGVVKNLLYETLDSLLVLSLEQARQASWI